MQALKRGEFKQIKGETYGTPKEVWGFRTRADGRSPDTIARDFLVANHELFGLSPGLKDITVQRRISSVGAEHLILQQRHEDLRIHRAYVTVHVDRRGRVYLAKNRAVPADRLPDKPAKLLSPEDVIGRALRSLGQPQRPAEVKDVEQLWFPKGSGVRLAWKMRIVRPAPPEEWISYVDARTGSILSEYDNLALATGRARVFDPSPVTTLGGHADLLTAARRARRPPPGAYREVRLRDLDDSGYMSGKRVTTDATPKQRRVRRTSFDWRCDAREPGFEEVMVYHHIDGALRYLEKLGFKGRRAIFREPVRVCVNGTREDNSWYSPYERTLTFGTGFVDDAEDGETILHELGHALQDAICPDFGQSKEAAAMGEGFGDYLAASFFCDRKPERYRACVMTWDGLLIGLEDRALMRRGPPCLRRVDDALTYADFKTRGDEHGNGPIWAAVLWDVRHAMEATQADTLIIESHFQLDGFTTFARAARSMLDADENLYGSAHATKLRKIFRKRKIELG